MRIPASLLIPYLPDTSPVEVLDANFGGYNPAMPYTDALGLIIQGRVEGVATRGGRLRYLRLLPEAEWPVKQESQDALDHAVSLDSGSTAFTNTNLGAYLQAIVSARMDEWGTPTKVVIGRAYAFCLLRGAGF
jgi:hypothetical protein